MDRYVIRGPRNGVYQQEHQIVSFSPNTGNKNMISPEVMYYGGYGTEFPVHRVCNDGYIATSVNPSFSANNLPPAQGQAQVMSGIDPRYLAAFADSNAAFIVGQQRQLQRDSNPIMVMNEYQNRTFTGPDRNTIKTITNETTAKAQSLQLQIEQPPKVTGVNETSKSNIHLNAETAVHKTANVSVKQAVTDVDLLRNELQNPTKTRSDKLKALYKSGPRAFSGPVEKVLKWHKALQDIGVLVLYEIVAKCVSVRPGESCAKNLVVRDENGPAMQVVYYEIDFLLPQLKVPCTVRVIGRMMPGTCRLQAFNVRPATGDDVTMLPRRAAIAAHHVAKLCKEYGPNTL